MPIRLSVYQILPQSSFQCRLMDPHIDENLAELQASKSTPTPLHVPTQCLTQCTYDAY
jgi:hypothetical protein